MVFSSLTFLLLFMPLFFAVYYLAPKKLKNGILFLFSLLFYSWGEPVYVVLMLFSTVLDYSCGLAADRFRGRTGAKIALIISLCVNIGLLCVFKYSDFAVNNLNAVFALSLKAPQLALPIGISFYTFQTMSYTIDVYRGEACVQKNIISFGAYVALFPQLIAGPIVRYQTVAEQINTRVHSFDMFGDGVKRFAAGLGKKILLANSAGEIWAEISALPAEKLSAVGAWLGIAAFGFQLYFDFSGYSDMAIGLGKMLGFTFTENFDYPYVSKSITEFWRRWHITLGSWFRDYVYIPLGGSRRGLPRQLFNIAVVWLLTGFWHGASWNFVLWGVYYGLLLSAEKLFILKRLKNMPAAACRAYTLFFVIIGWVLFAVEDMGKLPFYLRAMFGGGAFCSSGALYLLISSVPLLAVCVFASTPAPANILRRISSGLGELPSAAAECAGITAVMALCTASLVNGSYNPFLYFRF